MLKQTFFKSLVLLSLAVAVFATVAEAPTNIPTYTKNTVATAAPSTVVLATKPVKPSDALTMMSSTVRLHVQVDYVKTGKDDDGGVVESRESEAWAGSGVVYDKTDRADGPVRSRILTANHVLETPAIGTEEDDVVEFLGITINMGKRRVEAVKIQLQTADGRTCNVKVLALGSTDQHDTATAEADCDAGRVAELASAMPVMGERVFVSGYSLGVKLPMLTEGYVSGMMDGYLLTSAAAYGGNSGGPVFHDGKVIGLLVRGSREYTNLTLTATLEECLRRIAETPPL
jgi:S1-C subfamily serine protease